MVVNGNVITIKQIVMGVPVQCDVTKEGENIIFSVDVLGQKNKTTMKKDVLILETERVLEWMRQSP